MPPKLHPITDRDAWLALRKKYVTSTESASLFGLQMPSKPTAFELWHIKRDLLEEATVVNNYMVWGNVFESAIKDVIALDQPDWKILPMKAFVSDADGLGSSFDYTVAHPEKGVCILEIKMTTYREWKEKFIEDEVFIEAPPYYEIQCQHQLEVLDKYNHVCLAVALMDTREIRYIWRARDREMGAAIRKKIKGFWAAQKPPAPDLVADSDILARMHRANALDKAYDATKNDDFDMAAMAYLGSQNTIKHAEEAKKRARSQMILAMGDCNVAYGNHVKVSNKGSFRVTETKGK